MSFVIAIADLVEKDVSMKRFEARSLKECQEKVMNYVINQFEWNDDMTFPDEYNSFVELMKEYDIILSNITDVDLI